MQPLDTKSPTCKHCGAELQPILMPDAGGWDETPHWVCFNDECSYYQEGWSWMWERFRVKASYRYRVIDPGGGVTSPLPVWSKSALRDLIIDDSKRQGVSGGDLSMV
jgi:hypothetical protein